MEGEDRAGRDGEVVPASLTPEPERTVRAAALVDPLAPAIDADREAICLEPTHPAKGRLGFLIRHAKDGSQGERPGLG